MSPNPKRCLDGCVETGVQAAAGVVLVPGLLGVTSSLTVMLIILSSHTTRR